MTLRLALFFVAAATLMIELVLTRVFDVILNPNMAYMVIACALFSFGLAGVLVALQPTRIAHARAHWPSTLAMLFAISAVALRPALNILPFDYEAVSERPIQQLFAFAGMYLALVAPFFFSGLVFTFVSSSAPHP